MEFHTLTDGLPRMAEGDLAVLADDILRNGLICPILTFEGKIIDGRDRFAACELVGVKPDFQEATPEAMISVIMRKPTTTDQKAMIASRHLMSPEEAAAKKAANLRNVEGAIGPVEKLSVRAASATFAVHKASIAEAKRLRDIAESNGNADVVFEVEVGRISLKELAVALDVEPKTRKSKAKPSTVVITSTNEPEDSTPVTDVDVTQPTGQFENMAPGFDYQRDPNHLTDEEKVGVESVVEWLGEPVREFVRSASEMHANVLVPTLITGLKSMVSAAREAEVKGKWTQEGMSMVRESLAELTQALLEIEADLFSQP